MFAVEYVVVFTCKSRDKYYVGFNLLLHKRGEECLPVDRPCDYYNPVFHIESGERTAYVYAFSRGILALVFYQVYIFYAYRLYPQSYIKCCAERESEDFLNLSYISSTGLSVIIVYSMRHVCSYLLYYDIETFNKIFWTK